MSQHLQRLQNLAKTLDTSIEEINKAMHQLEQQMLSLIVVGEFKKGKSTFINALLGEPLLPSDILPTTATINRVTFGTTPSVTVRFKNNQEEHIQIEDLDTYVTKLTSETEERSRTVEEAVLRYPIPLCEHKVEIIDTPGLNDDDEMTAVTLSALERTQVVVIVTSATAPFAESESLFLTETILAQGIRHIVFVVNGIDQIRKASDVERLLTSIQQRISQSIETWAAEEYGTDTPEYEQYLKRIGTVQVHGLSAKQALSAKIAKDEALLKTSRFSDFEAALETLITQNRQQIAHQMLADTLTVGCQQALAIIEKRQAALTADNQQSAAAIQQLTQGLYDLRNQVKAGFADITPDSHQMKKSVEAVISALPEQIMKKAETVLDEALQAPDKKKGSAAPKLASKIQSALLLYTAKIESEITTGLKQAVVAHRQQNKAIFKAFNQHTEDLQRHCCHVEATYGREIFTPQSLTDESISISPLYDLISIDATALDNRLDSLTSELGIYAVAGATVGTLFGGPLGTAVGGAIAAGYEKNRYAKTMKKHRPQMLESIRVQIGTSSIREKAQRYITAETKKISQRLEQSQQQLNTAIDRAERHIFAVQGAQEAKETTNQKHIDMIKSEIEDIVQQTTQLVS